MARTRQLSDLRNDAYKLGDLENATTRFPASEVNYYINQGIAEFYDLLLRSIGEYFESQTTIITDGMNTVYPLPADFQRLLLAQVNLGWNFNGVLGDNNIGLYNFTLSERPELSSSTPGWAGQPFAYHIHGGTPTQANTTQGTIPVQYAIEFLPKPSVNMHIQVYYVPTCPLLVNDNDTLDTINGWDVYASAFASKLMRIKDDLPTTAQDMLLNSMRERIEAAAPHRDQYSQRRVVDVRKRWPAYSWRRRRVS